MKSIVLITSEHYSGKTTLTRLAKEHYGDECYIHHARPIIEKSLMEKGIPITRSAIRDEGQCMLEEGIANNYPGVISSAFMNTVLENSSWLHVIDSLYHPIEIDRWRAFAEKNEWVIHVVAIRCPKAQRLSNARVRHETFSERDLEEIDSLELTGKVNGQQIDVCMEMVDMDILNNSSMKLFIARVKVFLSFVENAQKGLT